MSMFSTAMFLETMGNLQRNIHEWAKGKGFWDEGEHTVIVDGCMGAQECTEKRHPINVAEKLALIHSEVSEALEAHRQGPPVGFQQNQTYWVCADRLEIHSTPSREMPIGKVKPEGISIELADAVIRIMDLCGWLGIDLGRAILDKMEYNQTRPHKHGKNY